MPARSGWGVSEGPGVTALGLAAARSVETSRGDRLIEDPFARALFEAAGADLPMLVEWPGATGAVSDAQALHLHGSLYIGLRTRFYDDTVLAAAGRGATQAVLLGAGLDTRAYRLTLPESFQLFEIEHAGVLDHKDSVLTSLGAVPRCKRSAIGIDLRDDWGAQLQAHGFDRRRATVWIGEGVLAYLTPEAQLAMLTQVTELSGSGSSLAMDRILGDPLAGDRLRHLTERSGVEMGGLLAGGEAQELGGFLFARGWSVEEEPTRTLANRYRRDLSNPFAESETPSQASEPPWLETLFITASRCR